MTLTRMKSVCSKPLLILSQPLWSYLYSYLQLCVTDPTFCFLMNDDDDHFVAEYLFIFSCVSVIDSTVYQNMMIRGILVFIIVNVCDNLHF